MADAQHQDAASRQAQDDNEQRLTEARLRFGGMGIDVGVRELTPRSAGFAVRVGLARGDETRVRYLDPQDAHDLAKLLEHDAMEAVHASRAGRRS